MTMHNGPQGGVIIGMVAVGLSGFLVGCVLTAAVFTVL